MEVHQLPHQRQSAPARLRPIAENLGPIVAAAVLVAAFAMMVPDWRDPGFVNLVDVVDGHLTNSQEQTITMVKELNSYLISITTIIFGGLGWYLTHNKSGMRPLFTRTALFTCAGLVSLAAWYAFKTYSELASELSQNSLALLPGGSRVFYYVELECIACGIAALLMLLIFADAVTRRRLS